MKMKKWMSAALIVSLVAANNQARGNVKAFISSDYVKSQVSVFDEQNGSITVTPTPIPTPTATPKILGGYAVTYINEGETTTEGWYPAGRTTTITLKTPEDRGREWRFVGWKDMEGNLHEAGTEVAVYNVPSATFTAVWEALPMGDFYATYIDGEDETHTGWYPIGYPNAITLKEPDAKEGYIFAGWKDYKGDLHQPGESVSISDVPSATFTAVWLELQETATPGAITTITPSAVVTPTPTMTMTASPTPTMTSTAMPEVTPTIKPTATPVAKKAKVKITTNAKKKFIVGKKYTIKAKRTNTSKKLTWSVSNKKYATINKNTGVLKAKKAGKITITVTCGNVKDKIKIVIKKK